jgi:putative DNA primase/helicase
MVYWRRPGKNEGHSATTNFANNGLLHVFTSSAPPFEADTSYAPFMAYALLEHGGDFKAAAQALQLEGYGIQHRHGMRTISVPRALPPLRTIATHEVLAWRR